MTISHKTDIYWWDPAGLLRILFCFPQSAFRFLSSSPIELLFGLIEFEKSERGLMSGVPNGEAFPYMQQSVFKKEHDASSQIQCV